MTKKELINLLVNSRAVPDDAEVVFHQVGQGDFYRPAEADVFFLIDQYGQGGLGG